jgi:capsular exopolysaccharide synthesis family protein
MQQSITPTPSAVGNRDLDLGQLPGVLWRRKWIIVFTVVIGLLAARAFIARLDPVYTASAQLMISPEPPVLDVQAVAAAVRGDAESTASEVYVLRSRDLASRVVDALNLVADPEFNPLLVVPEAPWWTRLFGAGNDDTAPTRPQLSPAQERNLVGSILLNRLEVIPLGKSRVISLMAHASTPEKAARLANAVIEQYLVLQVENKRDTTNVAEKWLAARTRQLEEEVRAREAAVEAYRASAGLLRGAGSARLSDEEASELSSQLVQARAERVAADAHLSEIQKLLDGDQPEKVGDVLDSPLVRNLREQRASLRREIAELAEQYGPLHPRIVNAKAQLNDTEKAINAEVAKVVSNLRSDAAVARAREQAIADSLDMLRANAGRKADREVRLRSLERDAESSRVLLETFLARSKETAAQSTHVVADARVISHATPPLAPSFPNTRLLQILASTGALLLGVMLALLREGTDRTVRTRAGLQRLLGSPVAGSLPLLRGRWAGFQSPARWVLRAPHSEYGEALRRMHTQLALGDLNSPPRVLLFTSALPGEGKTSTLLALGRLLANTGRKVVAVDMNLRKPTLHQAAGLKVARGLGDWFQAADNQRLRLHKDPLSALQVLPAGRLQVDSSVLLSSSWFEAMLISLRRDFDVVLLDSSPVLAVVDAQVLACMADATVLLVRAGRAPRAAVAEAHALLTQTCGAPPRVVLNAATQREEVPDYGHGLGAYYPDVGPRGGRLAAWRGFLPSPRGGSRRQ